MGDTSDSAPRSRSRAGEGLMYNDVSQGMQQPRSRNPSRPDLNHAHTYPQPGFNPSQSSFSSMQSYPMSPPPPSPMGEFGQQYHLPGYYDVHPQMGSPPPFNPSGMGYNTWAGNMPQRAFSPVQQPGPTGYGGGMSWYSGFGWPGMR